MLIRIYIVIFDLEGTRDRRKTQKLGQHALIIISVNTYLLVLFPGLLSWLTEIERSCSLARYGEATLGTNSLFRLRSIFIDVQRDMGKKFNIDNGMPWTWPRSDRHHYFSYMLHFCHCTSCTRKFNRRKVFIG